MEKQSSKHNYFTLISEYLIHRPTPPNLALMAAHFGYSRFYFSRLFHQTMGVTLREYSSALKIQRSIRTLSANRAVIEAQLDADYGSAGTFTNIFKRHTGLSPKAYRQTLVSFSQQLPQSVKKHNAKAFLYRHFHVATHRQPNPLHLVIRQPDNRLVNSKKQLLFVALFPQALPSGTPKLGICLLGQQYYRVHSIPDGEYYAMVCEIDLRQSRKHWLQLDSCRRDICYTPIRFPLPAATTITLCLRDKIASDPPIVVNPIKLLFDVLKPQKRNSE